jgi:hypothetical protein
MRQRSLAMGGASAPDVNLRLVSGLERVSRALPDRPSQDADSDLNSTRVRAPASAWVNTQRVCPSFRNSMAVLRSSDACTIGA